MRIIDELTQAEIANPDMSAGELRAAVWASPEAYATIDNVEKFALDDSDYEEVQIYHRWTAEETAQHQESQAADELQGEIDSLPDALSELAVLTADNSVDIADLQDAIIELAEIVAGMQ